MQNKHLQQLCHNNICMSSFLQIHYIHYTHVHSDD